MYLEPGEYNLINTDFLNSIKSIKIPKGYNYQIICYVDINVPAVNKIINTFTEDIPVFSNNVNYIIINKSVQFYRDNNYINAYLTLNTGGQSVYGIG